MSWTPLSDLNRASRIGPLGFTKNGTVLLAPSRAASGTCGLLAGLVPPIAGCTWHCAQELPLKRGPRPSPGSIVPETELTSWNLSLAAPKNANSSDARPDNGPPAPGAPPRGPGSV